MPGRFDRYVLRRLIASAAFFSIVFIGLFWLNQSLAVFDRVIADGRSLMVFFRLIVLYLPEVVAMMLPVIGLAASLQVFHRLLGERELVAWLATGATPRRTLRPVVLFALLIATLSLLFVHVLAPMSRAALSVESREIDRGSIARLIRPRSFVSLAPDVTLFVEEIDREGTFHHLFLHDERDADRPVTFIASKARMLKSGEATLISMEDGQTQRLDRQRMTLDNLTFKRFDYDLTPFLAPARPEKDGPANVRLLTTPMLLAQETDLPLRPLELTDRFMQLAFAFLMPLLGAASMMAGTYGRSGGGWRIALAVALAVGANLANGRMLDMVRNDAGAWPLAFAPAAILALVTALLLARAGKPLLPLSTRRSRSPTNEGEGAPC